MDGVPGLRDFTDTASEIRLDGHLLEMIVRIYYSLHLLGKVYIIFSSEKLRINPEKWGGGFLVSRTNKRRQ